MTTDTPPEDTQALLAQAEYYDAEAQRSPGPPAPPAANAAPAKIQAVSDLVAACYKRASELRLTPEETKALLADFPDECFQAGAQGKDQLIYIQHRFLRARLIEVLGVGQWSLVPIRYWEQPIVYHTREGDTDASRVFCDAVLLVRSCFVASAIGEMDYFPSNQSQSYGDAAEGSKTDALRRCAKEMGVGLQAWDKTWCQGWWQRKKRTPMAQSQQSKPQPQPNAALSAADQKKIDDWNKYRMRVLNQLEAAAGQRNRVLLTDYLTVAKILTVDQVLEDWPFASLPTKPEQITELKQSMERFDMERAQGQLQEEQL